MEKAVYKEFNLEQKFIADTLDYRIAENYATGLRHLETMTQLCYWIFDYHRNNFYFISGNTDFFAAKDKPFVQENGYDYFIRNTHPDDILYLLAIHKTAWKYLLNMRNDTTITNLKICYVIRLKNSEGDYVQVSQQVKPIETDSNNNMWLTMGVFEIVSPKVNYPPYIQNTVTGEVIKMDEIQSVSTNNTANQVTVSEKSLLQLISKDLKETEIADRMNISRNTVRSHRKNLYRKLQASNKQEAIKNAFYLGLLK